MENSSGTVSNSRRASATTRALYIQGCARSGNTLMRELSASGFHHMELVRGDDVHTEISLEHLVSLLATRADDTVLVASRNHPASLAMDESVLTARPDIRILWMLRHPFDVLTSMHPNDRQHYYVSPQRLINSLKLYDQFRKHPQVITVHYESLVNDADTIQRDLATRLQLEISHRFSEAYRYFSGAEDSIRAMHSIRPPDTASVNRWKQGAHFRYCKRVLKENPDIGPLAATCGYDLTLH
jgi:hypothetical protein